MSDQRADGTAAAEGAGAAGQSPSSSGSSHGRQADGSSQPPRVAAFTAHSAAAATADSAMSDADGGSSAATSASAAAVAAGRQSAATQPQSQPSAQGQTQGQPDQRVIDSMTLGKVIEAMAAVPPQTADEFAVRQLQLIDRLRQLLGCADPTSWSRAVCALSVGQALAVIQVALRVEGTGASEDQLVSDRSSG